MYHSWSPQIVAGEYAKRGEWPWQVQLGYFDISESIPHICGASILDHYWIITAAHCVKSQFKERPAANFNVTVGKYIRFFVHKWDIRDCFSWVSEFQLIIGCTEYEDEELSSVSTIG